LLAIETALCVEKTKEYAFCLSPKTRGKLLRAIEHSHDGKFEEILLRSAVAHLVNEENSSDIFTSSLETVLKDLGLRYNVQVPVYYTMPYHCQDVKLKTCKVCGNEKAVCRHGKNSIFNGAKGRIYELVDRQLVSANLQKAFSNYTTRNSKHAMLRAALTAYIVGIY